METITKNLAYRPYEDVDKEEVLQLWHEESGWGGITLQQFDSWFVNTPYGRCIIVVAIDEKKKVVGQIIFSPSEMIVGGRVIKTLRASAPILKNAFRQSSLRTLDHPAFALIKKGLEVASEAGYQYVYTFPSYGWLSMLRMFPKVMPLPAETASFDCFAISLQESLTYVVLDNDYKVCEATGLTEEYDQIWAEAVQQMPVNCGIVRKAGWLKWIIGGHLKLEVRTTGNRLIGYMAIKKETGLIVDVFARNIIDLQEVFRYSINALHHRNGEKIPVSFTQLKGMLTSHTQPIVESIGYTKENYRFAFGGYLLDTTIDFEKIKAANWYMTPLG